MENYAASVNKLLCSYSIFTLWDSPATSIKPPVSTIHYTEVEIPANLMQGI